MTLILELQEEEVTLLNAKASAEGLSAAQYAQQLLKQALSSAGARPLAVRIRDIWADLPEEDRRKLPEDGASQVDHYVHGLPKRER